MFIKVHHKFWSVVFQAVLSCLNENKTIIFLLNMLTIVYAYPHGMYAWLDMNKLVPFLKLKGDLSNIVEIKAQRRPRDSI